MYFKFRNVQLYPIAYKSAEKVANLKLHDLDSDYALMVIPFGSYLDVEGAIRCCTSSWRRLDDTNIPSRVKISGTYVNSILAKTEAVLAGFDEAIILNQDGTVSEGAGENLFLDEDGAPTALNTEGTIAIDRHDPGLMLRYVGAPEATEAKFQGDWYLTGDRGAMDAEGHITYLGRDDDMMNAGGYRVSPLEVEAALAGLPGVIELAVTDIAVKEDVRIVAAFYTAEAELDEEALKAAAAERLARYKCPRTFIRIDGLPRNPNGKLQRKALKDHVLNG